MRNAFAAEVTELAQTEKDLVLLSGDIGNRLFDPFKAQHADRFFNCGVAEANMVGVAAGMAMCGLKPVTYTITPFMTTRCLEQIRVDVCYHKLPVVIVGVGGGFSYAMLGPTHHSCEDISFLRSLPGMNVACAGDAHEVRALMRSAVKLGQPVYLRLGKKNEPLVHDDVPNLEIGKGHVLREGGDVCLLACGNILPVAVEAAELLERARVSTQVVSFHTVKPLDEPLLRDAFGRFQAVASIEEHSLIGGLGGALAEWAVDNGPHKARLVRFGSDDKFVYEAVTQKQARSRFGLTAQDIARRILSTLAESAAAGSGPARTSEAA